MRSVFPEVTWREFEREGEILAGKRFTGNSR